MCNVYKILIYLTITSSAYEILSLYIWTYIDSSSVIRSQLKIRRRDFTNVNRRDLQLHKKVNKETIKDIVNKKVNYLNLHTFREEIILSTNIWIGITCKISCILHKGQNIIHFTSTTDHHECSSMVCVYSVLVLHWWQVLPGRHRSSSSIIRAVLWTTSLKFCKRNSF